MKELKRARNDGAICGAAFALMLVGVATLPKVIVFGQTVIKTQSPMLTFIELMALLILTYILYHKVWRLY